MRRDLKNLQYCNREGESSKTKGAQKTSIFSIETEEIPYKKGKKKCALFLKRGKYFIREGNRQQKTVTIPQETCNIL